MEYKLLSNSRKSNHYNELIKLATTSDTVIIVSPFLTNDFNEIISDMPSIKNITLYTVVDGYHDAINKATSLLNLFEVCKNKSIDLIIKIDEDLHGKVYLFYKGVKEQGFILTSGNFTTNGLKKNHEYGFLVNDELKQLELAKEIMSVNTYDLSYDQICIIQEEAMKFLLKNPKHPEAIFHVQKIINKKPSYTQTSSQQYFLKPLGTAQKHFDPGRILEDNGVTGFNDKVSSIHKGDVMLCHSVGTAYIVGYYEISDDEQFYQSDGTDDRWPWKFHFSCNTSLIVRNGGLIKLKPLT